MLKCFRTPKRNTKKDPTSRPKNLQHLTFEDKRCKHSTSAKKKSLEMWQDCLPTKWGKTINLKEAGVDQVQYCKATPLFYSLFDQSLALRIFIFNLAE